MMKKEMLFAVLAIGYIVNAGLIIAKEQLITLPTKEVIAKRLRENGYTYFDEKMKLAENFGDQEKYVTGFVMHLELAILDFCEKNEKIPPLRENPALPEKLLLLGTFLFKH